MLLPVSKNQVWVIWLRCTRDHDEQGEEANSVYKKIDQRMQILSVAAVDCFGLFDVVCAPEIHLCSGLVLIWSNAVHAREWWRNVPSESCAQVSVDIHTETTVLHETQINATLKSEAVL